MTTKTDAVPQPNATESTLDLARDFAIAYDDGTFEFDEDSLGRFVDVLRVEIARELYVAPTAEQADHIADERKMVVGEVQAGAVQEAYQQFLDDTKDATRPYARHALVACIAECQALSYSEDRGITVCEAESIGGVLHELRRLQNLEAETVEVIRTGAPTEAVRPDAFDSLVAFHAEQLEANPYCYFELAYTRQTAWMAWITDRPAKGEPGTAEHAKSRKLIARGQGETPFAACADALAALAAPTSSAGDQEEKS
jgi:hypothetical protein